MKETREVLTCDREGCDHWFLSACSQYDYYTALGHWEKQGKPDVHKIGCECIGCKAHICFLHSCTFEINMGYNVKYTPLCRACHNKLTKLFELDTLMQIAKIIIEKPDALDEKLLESDDDIVMILRQIEMK